MSHPHPGCKCDTSKFLGLLWPDEIKVGKELVVGMPGIVSYPGSCGVAVISGFYAPAASPAYGNLPAISLEEAKAKADVIFREQLEKVRKSHPGLPSYVAKPGDAIQDRGPGILTAVTAGAYQSGSEGRLAALGFLPVHKFDNPVHPGGGKLTLWIKILSEVDQPQPQPANMTLWEQAKAYQEMLSQPKPKRKLKAEPASQI